MWPPAKRTIIAFIPDEKGQKVDWWGTLWKKQVVKFLFPELDLKIQKILSNNFNFLLGADPTLDPLDIILAAECPAANANLTTLLHL